MGPDEQLRELHNNVEEYAPARTGAPKPGKKAAMKLLAAAAAGAVALIFGGVELRCTPQLIAETEAVIGVRVSDLTDADLSDVRVDYPLAGAENGAALNLPLDTLSFTGLRPATTYNILFTIQGPDSTSTITYPFTTTGAYVPAAPITPRVPPAPPEEEPDDPPTPLILEPDPILPPAPEPPAPAPAATYTAPSVSVMMFESSGAGGGSIGWGIAPNDATVTGCSVASGSLPFTASYDAATLDAAYGDGAGGYSPSFIIPDGTFADGVLYDFTLTVDYTLNGAAGSTAKTNHLIVGYAGGFMFFFSPPPLGSDVVTINGTFNIAAAAMAGGTLDTWAVEASDTTSGALTPLSQTYTLDASGAASYSFSFALPPILDQLYLSIPLKWTSSDGVVCYDSIEYTSAYLLG